MSGKCSAFFYRTYYVGHPGISCTPQMLFFMVIVAADVLSEEVILKWYREDHSPKGKMMFLEQMKQFVEWLQNAEENLPSSQPLFPQPATSQQ